MTDAKLAHHGSDTRRLDRVESDVSSLAASVTELRTELRGFGSILGEIKESLKTRDQQAEEARQAAKPNVVAIIAVLVTIITALVGGAWLVGGQTARFDERHQQRDTQIERLQGEIDRLEDRQWRRANT